MRIVPPTGPTGRRIGDSCDTGVDERQAEYRDQCQVVVFIVLGVTTFHEVADGTAKVAILGNTVAMPEAAAAALRSASTAVPFPAGEFLPGADSRRALLAARQLLRLGALRIAT